MDERLLKNLEQLESDKAKKAPGLLEQMASIIAKSPQSGLKVPKSVPKALDMTPYEFMTEPMERFLSLCESTNYRRITSSLNYVANFAGKDVPEIKRRVEEIRTALREWKDGSGQSEPAPQDSDLPTESEDQQEK